MAMFSVAAACNARRCSNQTDVGELVIEKNLLERPGAFSAGGSHLQSRAILA
jgi:hypothetical protein